MSTCRLLILDDDRLVCKTIRHIAEQAGFEVRHELDGDGFLAAVDLWAPSHIVLDLVMPGLDGVQVIERLADRHCHARLIITSGLDTRVLEAARLSAQEQGLAIAGVLPKPFQPDTLRRLLGGVCSVDIDDVDAAAGVAEPVGRDGTRAGAATAAQPVMDAGAPLPPPPTPAALAQSLAQTEADLAEDLADAIAEGDLAVAYQPKVICETGQLAGFEVLVRWLHPLRGNIGPGEFVPLAERVGLIHPLTAFVLERSLPWFAEMRSNLVGRPDIVAPTGLHLSVNMSACCLGDPGFVEQLAERCQRFGVAPRRLMLELTETAAMEDPVGSLALLTRLRMKGFQLSIDDFGTGFSSMLQLVRLPFSEVKVDRSFVSSLIASRESKAVVRSIIDLGHSLGLQVAAEGVEDEETMDFLVTAGCDLAQGYLVARPLTPVQVPVWLAVRWPEPVREPLMTSGPASAPAPRREASARGGPADALSTRGGSSDALSTRGGPPDALSAVA